MKNKKAIKLLESKMEELEILWDSYSDGINDTLYDRGILEEKIKKLDNKIDAYGKQRSLIRYKINLYHTVLNDFRGENNALKNSNITNPIAGSNITSSVDINHCGAGNLSDTGSQGNCICTTREDKK